MEMCVLDYVFEVICRDTSGAVSQMEKMQFGHTDTIQTLQAD